jgi:addiction module HigA family antidote
MENMLSLVGRTRIRRRDSRLSQLGETMATKLLEPIPPGEILSEEFMKPLELSINALAREIDVPPNRISEIVGGKRAITADTALRLGKYFGVSPEIWLGLQADFDIRVARQTTWPKIEPRVRARAA